MLPLYITAALPSSVNPKTRPAVEYGLSRRLAATPTLEKSPHYTIDIPAYPKVLAEHCSAPSQGIGMRNR
jgi:hypothetical protein